MLRVGFEQKGEPFCKGMDGVALEAFSASLPHKVSAWDRHSFLCSLGLGREHRRGTWGRGGVEVDTQLSSLLF
jgi:hypothetical protein